MIAKYPEHILELARRYSAHFNHSLKTVSLRAARRGGFFDELAKGANITVRRGDAIIAWFSDNWPDQELEWPRSIPRPKPSKKEAA